ncbi:hypothetical protein B566_EDAN004242 [Ephemera danica]|nr:hypothetical protein B566_EDAN004242 [Ephemera danica]
MLANVAGRAIDCFKCVSVAGSNPPCDDPFHNNYSTALLESPCMGGRKGRNGLFPATACIKLNGIYGTLFFGHGRDDDGACVRAGQRNPDHGHRDGAPLALRQLRHGRQVSSHAACSLIPLSITCSQPNVSLATKTFAIDSKFRQCLSLSLNFYPSIIMAFISQWSEWR